MLRIIHFQGFQRVFSTLDYLLGHPGHPGHMDSEAVGCATFTHLAQEDDLGANLLHCDMEIPDPGVHLLEVVEFMVVGGEESLGSVAVFVDIFNDGAGDRHSVVGRSAAADLIFLGLDQFVPLELVIREKGLGVTDRYRLRVPGQVLESPVLVYTTEIRVNRKAAAGKGHVLRDGQADAVLKVVGVGVTERSVLIALQQGQGAVEVHQVAVKVERGKPAGLVGPVSPVGRDEGVFRLQGSHRLRPCRADRLLKCHRALGWQRQWDCKQQTR